MSSIPKHPSPRPPFRPPTEAERHRNLLRHYLSLGVELAAAVDAVRYAPENMGDQPRVADLHRYAAELALEAGLAASIAPVPAGDDPPPPFPPPPPKLKEIEIRRDLGRVAYAQFRRCAAPKGPHDWRDWDELPAIQQDGWMLIADEVLQQVMTEDERDAAIARLAHDPESRRNSDAATRFLAQVAYEAYNAARGGLAYDGSPIPGWAAVKGEIQDAWQTAVVAVLENGLTPGEHERVVVRVLGRDYVAPASGNDPPPPDFPPPPPKPKAAS